MIPGDRALDVRKSGESKKCKKSKKLDTIFFLLFLLFLLFSEKSGNLAWERSDHPFSDASVVDTSGGSGPFPSLREAKLRNLGSDAAGGIFGRNPPLFLGVIRVIFGDSGRPDPRRPEIRRKQKMQKKQKTGYNLFFAFFAFFAFFGKIWESCWGAIRSPFFRRIRRRY